MIVSRKSQLHTAGEYAGNYITKFLDSISIGQKQIDDTRVPYDTKTWEFEHKTGKGSCKVGLQDVLSAGVHRLWVWIQTGLHVHDIQMHSVIEDYIPFHHIQKKVIFLPGLSCCSGEF